MKRHLTRYYLKETGEYAELSSTHGWLARSFWGVYNLPRVLSVRRRVFNFLFPLEIKTEISSELAGEYSAGEYSRTVSIRGGGAVLAMYRVRAVDGLGLFDSLDIEGKDFGFIAQDGQPSKPSFRQRAGYANHPVFESAFHGWMKSTSQFETCPCRRGSPCGVHSGMTVATVGRNYSVRSARWKSLDRLNGWANGAESRKSLRLSEA